MSIFKDFFLLAVLAALMFCIMFLVRKHESLEQKMERYNCSLSEFAPDFPQEVRNECRRQRLEAFNRSRDVQQ